MKTNWTNIRYRAKLLWLWLLRKDILIYALFVGLATIFWWGRAMSSPRDINMRIPVNYVGTTGGVEFANPLPHTITVTIRDNGKQLRQIAKQNLQLNLDLSHYLTEEKGTLNLTAEVLRPKLQDLLPGSTAVQHLEPEAITTEYTVLQQKLVSVHVASHITVAPQHQLVGEPQITPSHVYIYGAQADIDSIDSIITDSIYYGDLRDSIQITAQLVAPKNIRVHPRQVVVKWQAEPFTEKTFTLPIYTEGIPEGKYIRLFPQRVDVVVRVGISHFAQVARSDMKAICRYPTTASKSLPVEIVTENPYISNIRFTPSEVEYIIEKVDIRE